MKRIIIYASKNGCTEKAVRLLQAKFADEVKTVNIAKEKAPDLALFDTVILGGPIYVGKPLKVLSEYMQQNLEILKGKELALFVCAGEQDMVLSRQQIASAYPEELYSHAKLRESFGGELYWDRLDFMTKLVLRLVKGIKTGYSRLSEAKIEGFAKEVLNMEM